MTPPPPSFLVQGEQFGRVGSRRWVSEVQAFSCTTNVSAAASSSGRAFCAQPLRTNLEFPHVPLGSRLTHVVAADQLGAPGLAQLFFREDDRRAPVSGGGGGGISEILVALGSAGLLPLPVNAANATAAPPPTPLLSFQEAASPPLAFDGAVLSGYDAAFSSRAFHSAFDDAANVDAGAVAASATVLAQLLYALATGLPDAAAAAAAVPQGLAANATLAGELVSCFTVSMAACAPLARLLNTTQAAVKAKGAPASPVSLYPSVFRAPYRVGSSGFALSQSWPEQLVRLSLAEASALRNASGTFPDGGCPSVASCRTRANSSAAECVAGTCVLTSAFYHDALSPALSPDAGRGYGAFLLNASAASATDPVWTEPYWSSHVGATAFLMDSPAAAGGVLAAGIVTVLAALPGVWALVRFLDKHYPVP